MTTNDGADTTAHTPSAAAAREAQGSVPLAAVVLAVAAYLTYGTLTMDVAAGTSPPGPRFFPVIVTVVAYVAGALLLVQGLRTRRRPAADAVRDTDPTGGADTDDEAQHPIDWRQVVIVAGTFAAFILVLEPVGWLVSGALLFAGVSYGLGSTKHLVNLGAGLVLASVIQLAFGGGLGLPLPAGILAGI